MTTKPFEKFDDFLRPPKTLELDRMHGVRSESNSIGEFLDWLIGKYGSVELPTEDEDDDETETFETRLIDLRPEELLHEYFNIDKEKIERERREVMAYQRLLNEWSAIRKELCLEDDRPL